MSLTVKELVAQAKQEVEEIDAAEAARRLADGAVAVDVREADELERGYIPGAEHILRGFLEMKIGKHEATKDPDTPLVVYCAGGARSALGAQSLQQLGYTRVASLAGGFGAWVEAGQSVALGPDAEGDESE